MENSARCFEIQFSCDFEAPAVEEFVLMPKRKLFSKLVILLNMFFNDAKSSLNYVKESVMFIINLI